MKKLLTCLLLLHALADKAQLIAWQGAAKSLSIAERVSILEDPAGKLNINQVSSPEMSGKFKPSQQKILHFGFTNSTYWLRFSMPEDTPDSLLLVLEQALLPTVDLYYRKTDAGWQCYKSGYKVELNDKIIRSHYQIFPLQDKGADYYVRIVSHSPPVPIKIWKASAYEEVSTDQKLNYGLYSGILFFVILSNAFLFFSLRKFAYLHYALQVLLYLLCSAAVMDGYIIYFFPHVNLSFCYTFIPMLGMANVSLYALHFLDVKTFAPRIYKFALFVCFYFVSYLGWCFLLPQLTVIVLNQVHALLSLAFMFFLGLQVGLKGSRMGYYFALAYLIYFLVVIIEMIYIQTGAPAYFFYISHVSVAILTEVMLLAYLLSKRFSWEKQDIQIAKEEAQQLLLHKTQENEQLVRNQNIVLEDTVKQRTAEIAKQKEIAERALAEKEVLLKEIHHRVKNNLQTISSMLMLQSSTLNDVAAKDALTESQSRVRSIALVHQKLYQTEGMEKVELSGLIESLVSQGRSLYQLQAKNITISQSVPETHILMDKAIPLGLIINELLTNSYKHAFANAESGSISISLQYLMLGTIDNLTGARRIKLSYTDSGKGLPSLESSPSKLGLRLVYLLAEQIGAVVEYTNVTGPQFDFTFDMNA